MKNSALLFSASVLLTLSACNGGECISGSGNQTTQNRSVDPFTQVEVSGSMKVILKQSANQQVRIVADDNIQDEVKTRVNGSTLSIDMDGNFCNTGDITVYLSAKNYEKIDASGAVEIVSDGKINAQNFELDLSGSNKVTLDINAANMKTEASGSSDIMLEGQAGTHEVNLSGAGEINALNFVVGKYNIKSSGASKSRINVLNELNVRSSGASEVEYRGSPAKVSNDDSGTSSVKKIN